MADSATIIGSALISRLAYQLDWYLITAINGKQPSVSQISSIGFLLRNLEAAAQERILPASLRAELSRDESVSGSRNPLPDGDPLLIIDSKVGSEEIARQLKNYGYSVHLRTSAKSVEAYLASESPAVIIMDTAYLHQDLLEVLRAPSSLCRPPLLFTSVREDLDTRLAALRAGGIAFFTKPLDVIHLVDKLDSLIALKEDPPYRIMLVGDDASSASRTASFLERASMRVRVITDPQELLEALPDFQPELILMDLSMPGYSGTELTSLIRQQESYVGTPIVFLSADPDKEKYLDAMRAGGDDMLPTSIPRSHLTYSIEARVKRARILNSFMATDSLTGLLNHSNIKEQLAREVARVRRYKGVLAYAILDLDHFKAINDTYGHAEGDRVLKGLARLLRQRLRRSDILGRYGGEEFALVLPDTDALSAMHILDEIRRACEKNRYQAGDKRFSVTLSAGIAACPPVEDAVKLHDVADHALYRAKELGRNRVLVAEEALRGL